MLRGTEQLLTDMVLEPEFAEALFWKVEEGLKALYLAQLDAVGEFVEWVEMGDDLGTQAGPLISPATYRSLLKPVHADLIRAIKAHSPNVRVMYHTCGSIRRFLPDLVEIGVDILNPIQVAAKGMDPAVIKAEFGDRLCFLGGVDAQHLLPAGRPDEVREEGAPADRSSSARAAATSWPRRTTSGTTCRSTTSLRFSTHGAPTALIPCSHWQ